MSAPDEPDSPTRPDRQPMRDLLLAQALDACIDAERQVPGSSEEVIARQPAWARGELRRLAGLAGSLDAATSNAYISEDFRAAARQRLMRRIGADTSGRAAFVARAAAASDPAERKLSSTPPTSVPRLAAVPPQPARRVATRRKLPWLWRVAAGLIAAMLGVVATLTASANALPGEPLYSVKQASEDLEVRLAGGDEARAQTLLRQADTRLAETARLLQLGRTGLVAETTQRYDDVVERAVTMYASTRAAPRPTDPATIGGLEMTLSEQHTRIATLLQSAPEQSQAMLRQALVASDRGRDLMAEARPPQRPQIAAIPPTPSPAVVAVVATDEPHTPPGVATAAPNVLADLATAAPYMAPVVTDLATAAPFVSRAATTAAVVTDVETMAPSLARVAEDVATVVPYVAPVASDAATAAPVPVVGDVAAAPVPVVADVATVAPVVADMATVAPVARRVVVAPAAPRVAPLVAAQSAALTHEAEADRPPASDQGDTTDDASRASPAPAPVRAGTTEGDDQGGPTQHANSVRAARAIALLGVVDNSARVLGVATPAAHGSAGDTRVAGSEAVPMPMPDQGLAGNARDTRAAAAGVTVAVAIKPQQSAPPLPLPLPPPPASASGSGGKPSSGNASSGGKVDAGNKADTRPNGAAGNAGNGTRASRADVIQRASANQKTDPNPKPAGSPASSNRSNQAAGASNQAAGVGRR